MRVYYADAGLIGNSGHHADQCRVIVDELGARGIPVSVLGFAELEPTVRASLQARSFFRWYRYAQSDGDPERGWFNAFERGARTTREDLATLGEIGADDVVFLASASAAQLMGAALWLTDLAPAGAPQVVMHFGMDPGVDAQPAPGGGVRLLPRDPRIEATAALCRRVAPELRKLGGRRLRVGYAYANGAAAYRLLLDHAVEVVPLWECATTGCRNRVGKRPIVVGVLGHQRNPDKGYHLVPEIVAALLQSDADLRFLAHNAGPTDMPQAQEAMRELAAREPRVTLVEQAVDRTGWIALLDSVDLVLCPYSPRRYQLLPSGIHAQAIANAIPSVVPAGTALAQLSDEFGAPGTTFTRNDAPSVLDALRRALERYDHYAAIAASAAAQWPSRFGPGKLVDSILGTAGAGPSR